MRTRKRRDRLSRQPQPLTTEPEVIRWQADPERRAAGRAPEAARQQLQPQPVKTVTVGDDLSTGLEPNAAKREALSAHLGFLVAAISRRQMDHFE